MVTPYLARDTNRKSLKACILSRNWHQYLFLHDAPNDPGDDEGGDDLEDRCQQLDQEPAVPGVRKGALGLEVF